VPVVDLPGYSEGQWWVQDAAAALPALLLGVQPEERVADLCAAPGGKTAQLASRGARVVAFDRSAERLKRLSANLERLRLTADITVGDILTCQAGPFDAVLLDAPCTATGTIRRHPDVAWIKRASDIPALAAMQAKMLDRAVAMVRPGGRIVYCTCSLEPEEGEAQIAALLRRNPDVVRAPVKSEEIFGLAECLTPAGDLRTLPTHLPDPKPRLSGLAAFFAARLVRRL
jgi:16S rRNA (cytosine967-C5)-methyltransferase